MSECPNCGNTKEHISYGEGRCIFCPACEKFWTYWQQDEIKLLRSRLTIAEETLRAIRDHEHCSTRVIDSVCKELPIEESGMLPPYHIGRVEGHRCCATIASEGLKRMEGVK